jgi:integrase
VPTDVVHHFSTGRIVLSLGTSCPRFAASRAAELSAQLEREWYQARWLSGGPHADIGRYRVTDVKPVSVISRTTDLPRVGPLIHDARELYTTFNRRNRPKTFFRATERAVEELTSVCGVKCVGEYTRADANALRDTLLTRGLKASSIRRTLATLNAIIGFACREHGLEPISAFSSVHLPDDEQGKSRRQPLDVVTIKKIQEKCLHLDDEPRWLIALVSDSGMRLSEAAGLCIDDIDLESQTVSILPRPWRRLKTDSSTRVVPLVGASRWAVQRALDRTTTNFLFSRYCSDDGCKANSASGGLNKWLKPRVPEGCVIHSFRHSLRDRLRAVECPPDIIDRIGGWSVGGVGESYGHGYPMPILRKWMERIVLN